MKRHKFNLSNERLMPFNQGKLLPINTLFLNPGDSIQAHSDVFLRVSPLLKPILSSVEMKIHHWWVPIRQVWDEFEDFVTGGEDGNAAPTYPYMLAPTTTGYAVNSLADYFGLDPEVADYQHSALPFRALARIWNYNYRDKRFQSEVTQSVASGEDTTTNRDLLGIAWEKDYFTTAADSPQLGDPVTIPLVGSAPVYTDVAPGTADLTIREGAGPGYNKLETDGSVGGKVYLSSTTGAEAQSILVDLATATGIDIITLRRTLALQRFQEARGQWGADYADYLRYIGVRPRDGRLNRPTYLGGGKRPVQFSEVLQHTPNSDTGTSEDDGVGKLFGHGIGTMRSNRYRFFADEHGYVISLMYVKPRTLYAQGMERHWMYNNKYDLFQKELQHIGQQEIRNAEVKVTAGGGGTTNFGVWGYQDRYDELRRSRSTVHGKFRTTEADWHMGRIFATRPDLGEEFITCDPTDRVYAAPTEDQLYMKVYNNVVAKRTVAPTGIARII